MKAPALLSPVAAALLLLCGAALARSGPEHRAFRPLAMGNAFVAVVDDKDALYYNPAGLNLINSLGNRNRLPEQAAYPRDKMNARVNMIGFAGEDMRDFLGFFEDHRNSFESAENFRNDSTIEEDGVPFARKPVHAGVLHGAEFAMHDFGLAYWADARVAPFMDDGLLFQQAAISSMQIDAVVQVAGARGYFDDRLSLGVGYRLANRQEVRNFEVSVGQFAQNGGKKVFSAIRDTADAKLENLNDITSYGHGIDLGALWQQNAWLRFGAAVQNLGMYLDGKSLTPEFTVGAAVTPPLLCAGGRFSRKVNLAFDLEDLLNNDRNYRLPGKVNFGAEVEQNVSWVMGLRLAGGFKGGYWTAGTGLSLFQAIHIDAVSWAEEAGYYTGQYEERYYAINLGLGI